jgi:TRAP-type mannitol/chloroaromatic compound transport system permease small subunit
MRPFLRTIDRISEWSGKTFSWLLLAVMLIIGFEIFMRIFDNPQIWVFDVTLFLAGAVYVVGGAYTLLKNRHVKMDVLYVRLSPRMQSLFDLITIPGFIIFCGVLLYQGGIRAWESFLINEKLFTGFRPIVWPVRCMIPLGGQLLLLQGRAKFVRDFYMVIKGVPLE